jgi:16S rRNA (guanine1207-N2)-methyltransferase
MSNPAPSSPRSSAAFSHYFVPRGETVRASPPVTMHCAGLELQLSTGAGVFAKKGVDAGTQLLLESFFAANPQIADGARLCDLGCGWGAVGCFLGRHYANALIAMCDINGLAVQLAQQNAQRNAIQNAQLWCGDGLTAARTKYFHAILCNPPVRAGNAVIAELFVHAQRCLQTNGELWVVLRTQQGAKSWQRRLAAQFGQCETVAIESGYRILLSRNS